MAELGVVGDGEFVMGFQLIGLRKIFEADTAEHLKKCFSDAINSPEIGIIVTNDTSISKLDQHFRNLVENSVSPVVVVLSSSPSAQENMRELVKKAIGIDLLSKG